jgi:hypothetical protein
MQIEAYFEKCERVPCDGCALWSQCALELMACKHFSLFAHGHPWEAVVAAPSKERFARLFDS